MKYSGWNPEYTCAFCFTSVKSDTSCLEIPGVYRNAITSNTPTNINNNIW